MKNLPTMFFSLLLIVSFISPIFGQGETIDERAWSIVKIDPNAIPSGKVPSNWVPADQVVRYYDFRGGTTVGPNYRVLPGNNTTQSELSIDVHPSNPNISFGSSNATNWPVSTLYGTGVYWTLDGGASWTGFDNPPFGSNSGDPVSVIGADGRFYENYITNSLGQGVAVSTNNGINWTTYIVAPNPGSVADKNHYMVDKTVTSPYVNNSYCVWTDFGGATDGEVVLRKSTNFGVNWSSSINVSGTLTPLGSAFAQGANVQTGPNGELYVTYAIYDADWLDGEDAIGFSKSTDGGTTWTHLRAYNQINFGVRGNLPNKNNIRVASFPSMSVDRSGGPRNGWIYITWPQDDVAPAGNDPDIALIRSTDGGATWSAPVRVNDDPINNGKDQYFSWCTVDQVTGQLILIFYDSRDVPNNQAEVYMAASTDGGTTFQNFEVSDQPHTPMPINGLAGGYAGDYIGVAAYDDVAYPFWADNRLGSDHYQAWTASVTFGPPCPISPATNPSPANGTTGLPLKGNSISWTNGAGANTIEVWFGPSGNLSQVYTGSPISSYFLASFEPLIYNTSYSWQIKGLNDSCTVSGPMWSFSTMQDPNIITVTIDLYPQNANYWTGTCNASAKTQISLVNAGGTEVGWMAFDITPIVNDPSTVIDEIEFNGYLYANNWPYWSITPMGSVNPITGPASSINTQVSNNYQQGTAYSYNQESGTLTNGWLTRILEPSAETDLKNALGQGWFAIGVVDFDFSTTYYVNYQGWQETNRPYLSVTYSYVVPVELTSFTAQIVNEGVELNWATATETNNQGFEIERAPLSATPDQKVWEQVGYVAGFGTTTEPKTYKFVDAGLETGNYVYRLKQIDFNGSYEYSDEVNVVVALPLEYSLEQNYPNPFNPSTTIKYSVAEDGYVKLAVYNLLGEEVALLVNTQQKAGRYEIVFNGSQLSSGMYVYRIETGNYTSSMKLMLMK